MNKYLSILLLIFISGCAGTTQVNPTQAPAAVASPTAVPAATKAPASSSAASSSSALKPTSPPAPTATVKAATPKPTDVGIAVLNVKQEKQADGSIRTSANLSTQDNLGLGQIDLAYPDTMKLGDSTSIRLRLSPAQQLAALTPVAAPGKTPDLPSVVYKIGGNIQLYPIMYAQLRAVAFDIDQKQAMGRIVESSKSVEWIWAIKPTVAGRHDLVVELSIPIILNGVASELSTHVLQDLALTILVNAPTPPTAVPTPPLSERLIDSVVGNTGAIIAALIGVIGTLIGGILALRRKSG